jgi:hypothetical protein
MIKEKVLGSEYVKVPTNTVTYRAGTRRGTVAKTEGQNLEPR